MKINNLEEFNHGHIIESNEKEHDEMIETMRNFFNNEKPKVGIFWFDFINKTLFGVEKGDAEKYINDKANATYPKLHKDYWKKHHFRAISKNEKDSIFYKEKNYTMIPRGRVFVRPDNTFYVTVGEWINGVINSKHVFEENELRELIIDEFNLPDNFDFMIDKHWNLGKGWSEEKFLVEL